MAAHGQDMIFIMAWNQKTGHYNIVTAGSNEECRKSVGELANRIAQGLEADQCADLSASSS